MTFPLFLENVAVGIATAVIMYVLRHRIAEALATSDEFESEAFAKALKEIRKWSKK